jgi:outer membrane protein assembly factor BamB
MKKNRLNGFKFPSEMSTHSFLTAEAQWLCKCRTLGGLLLSVGLLLCLSLVQMQGADWPHFLGSKQDLKVDPKDAEGLWPDGGLRMEWEFAKGSGWACPIVSGDAVLIFHRKGDEEVVDCLSASTGSVRWHFAHHAPYRDRFGASDGPRTSPVVEDKKVYVFGVTGVLHCLALEDGKVLWKRDLHDEYKMRRNFFGHGSTPLVHAGRLIVPIGGAEEQCVLALDAVTGNQVWVASHRWGAGYASAVPAEVSGRALVLVFTGGETRPPTGGLLCIDAASGQILGEISHRARIAESVNAASPVRVGANRIFVTEAYGAGGLLAEISPGGTLARAWQTDKLGSQFATPLYREGLILGSNGQNPRLGELVCLDAETGAEKWREDFGGRFGRCNLVDLGASGILALGESGELMRLRVSPEKCEVLQRQQLFEAPESWTVPVVAGGRLWVCQNERGRDGSGPRVLCFGWRGNP